MLRVLANRQPHMSQRTLLFAANRTRLTVWWAHYLRVAIAHSWYMGCRRGSITTSERSEWRIAAIGARAVAVPHWGSDDNSRLTISSELNDTCADHGRVTTPSQIHLRLAHCADARVWASLLHYG